MRSCWARALGGALVWFGGWVGGGRARRGETGEGRWLTLLRLFFKIEKTRGEVAGKRPGEGGVGEGTGQGVLCGACKGPGEERAAERLEKEREGRGRGRNGRGKRAEREGRCKSAHSRTHGHTHTHTYTHTHTHIYTRGRDAKNRPEGDREEKKHGPRLILPLFSFSLCLSSSPSPVVCEHNVYTRKHTPSLKATRRNATREKHGPYLFSLFFSLPFASSLSPFSAGTHASALRAGHR